MLLCRVVHTQGARLEVRAKVRKAVESCRWQNADYLVTAHALAPFVGSAIASEVLVCQLFDVGPVLTSSQGTHSGSLREAGTTTAYIRSGPARLHPSRSSQV